MSSCNTLKLRKFPHHVGYKVRLEHGTCSTDRSLVGTELLAQCTGEARNSALFRRKGSQVTLEQNAFKSFRLSSETGCLVGLEEKHSVSQAGTDYFFVPVNDCLWVRAFDIGDSNEGRYERAITCFDVEIFLMLSHRRDKRLSRH